ncbi:MAG: TPR domain protein [uncultured Sphingomonadaceae bacterium]|uniref:TPR domain protein n=1 Tax=uncultured Sphingomonadaceae bacterium TaxID=169976 RepID=A0A6J4U3V7_9SPHN|nr:MAG: TPR domain protein [uncultured Sphingomonadaceae bacterium]
MIDVNKLFGRAETAFAAGRFAEARDCVRQVLRVVADDPACYHLLALTEKRSGDAAAADRAFGQALALAPRDPQINNNYANLLDETGRTDLALIHYDKALAANPRHADALFNRGLIAQRSGRADDALRDYDAVLEIERGSVRAHSARGSVLRNLTRFAEAAAAYDAALALAPNHARALDGRARVALEVGEPDAAARFERALVAQPGAPHLVIGMAEALEAEGDSRALSYLTAAVAARPDWIEGQERLAAMRAENADPDHFARGFVEALARDPRNRALHVGHWRALARAGRHDEALAALNGAAYRFADDYDTQLMRAVFVGEAGDAARACDLLKPLGDAVEVRTVQGRMALRLGEPEAAAKLLEGVVAERPDDIAAWAQLGLAWRIAGDDRHAWLCEQPGLFGTLALDVDDDALAALAARLRTLHRTRAHPIGQSLRGGTQTRGRLFWRSEPEIVALRDAITVAVRRFADALPPADDAHPLLRHRDRSLAFAGSWSVRLSKSGFHVNHIHPHGVLSSACYIALPESLGGQGGTDGWLELGAAPVELGLAVGPLAVLEPRPGRLALFPSYLYHGTRPFSSGERLTVAFDLAAT